MCKSIVLLVSKDFVLKQVESRGENHDERANPDSPGNWPLNGA